MVLGVEFFLEGKGLSFFWLIRFRKEECRELVWIGGVVFFRDGICVLGGVV